MTSWSLAKCACPSWSSITDESALRRALASFDDFGSTLHWWLGFWTFLVALGVVLEVVFVVWEYWEEMHDFRRGVIHAPEIPNTALFVLGLLGAGLVAAGVSGELWEESQIAKQETCIRKGNDALFLLLSKEASDAATSARTARSEAEASGKEAGKAQKKAEKAESSAQRAGRDAHSAQQDAAKVHVDLEAAELQRHEMEEILQIQAEYEIEYPHGPPLRMFKNGVAIAAESLRDLPPATARVEYKEFDPEAHAFAGIVFHTLRIAGWNVIALPSAIGSRFGHAERLPISGVRIFNKYISSNPIPSLSFNPQGFTVLNELTMNAVSPLLDQGLDEMHARRLGFLSMELGADLVKNGIIEENSFLIVVGVAQPKDK